MKSYQEYLTEAAAKKTDKKPASKDRSSNKVKAMQDLVDNLKHLLNEYDIVTRKFIWERLTSTAKGKELMDKILRNPKTYLSMSEFTQLVTKK